MLDDFVELMYEYYNSELDMEIDTPHKNMIEYKIFKPCSNWQSYLLIYIFESNQTKGYYVDLVDGDNSKTRINTYDALKIIKEWNNLW